MENNFTSADPYVPLTRLTYPGRTKVPCDKPEYWWIFLLSSVLTPVILSVPIILYRLGVWFFCSSTRGCSAEDSPLLTPRDNYIRSTADLNTRIKSSRSSTQAWWLSLDSLQEHAQRFMTTKSVCGQIFAFMILLTSETSYFLYLAEVSTRCENSTSKTGTAFAYCLESRFTNLFIDDTAAVTDLALNCFFIVYFVIRFIASNKKIAFLFELYSVVDYFTIPPAFVGLVLNHTWTGFRFLRVLCLLNVPDILQSLHVLRGPTSMRLTQLLCTIASVLLAAAGVFHLLENSADPFSNNRNYWEFVYFCIITAGTVGYGDITCHTVLGRICNAIFIMSTLAVVATVLPDIFEIITKRKKYGGHYTQNAGKKHVVLCGNVNFVSAVGFLKEFLHKDRGSYEIKVVFMDLKEPDVEMEGLLKRHFTEVEYLQGTPMHGSDLQRARANTCEACIILANKYCMDPDAEDAASIMRVISIKNFNSSTRVIVELMQYHNKAYLLNIPSWNWKNGDEVVCLAELKLGLIAQSCIAPGFSTLMANLFTSRSFSSTEKYERWKSEYLRGTEMEMYPEILSSAFVGLTFSQTAEICLLKLDILLLAISYYDPKEEDYAMLINPKPSVVIEQNTQGFFIADSAIDVQRAATYCRACHKNIHRVSMIKKCGCGLSISSSHSKVATQDMSQHILPKNKNNNKLNRKISTITKEEKVEIFIQNFPSTPRMKRSFEFLEPHVGTYLVVPLLNKLNNSLSDHESEESGADISISEEINEVPMEVLEQSRFDSTGMFHWCPPRPFESALIDRYAAAKKQFRQHVVVGIFADPTSPLIGLNSLVMPLRSSNFKYESLKEVVILGNVEYLQREWKNLYNFPKVTIVKGTALSRADLRALSIYACSMCVILTAKVPNSQDSTLTDKEVIMASLNIKAMDFEPRAISRASRPSSTSSEKAGAQTPGRSAIVRKLRLGARIPMITDLFNDPNVQFLDPDDDDNDEQDTGFFATEPFACGTAFTASVLDSLISMVYFNPSAFRVIRALIFGGASSELEEMLAEGAGLIGGGQLSDEDHRNRSFISQIKLKDFPFREYADSTFGDLFVGVLKDYGILCLGIFRFLNDPAQGKVSTKRYVITKPAPNNRLQLTDHIFVLMQSDFGVSVPSSSGSQETGT